MRTSPVNVVETAHLADDERVFNDFGIETAAHHDDAEGNGQIVGGAFLADGGGREVDNNAFARIGQTGVADGGLDARGRFFHSRVRKTDNIDERPKKPLLKLPEFAPVASSGKFPSSSGALNQPSKSIFPSG